MKYQIRSATSQDLIPAINLAWQMFLKYDAEDYGEEHTGRMGIATALMKRTSDELKEKGFKDIVLNASPYGVPFYKSFGFSVEENERNPLTPWKTPMTYSLTAK